jgi:hypothetical protein
MRHDRNDFTRLSFEIPDPLQRRSLFRSGTPGTGHQNIVHRKNSLCREIFSNILPALPAQTAFPATRVWIQTA